MKGSKELFEEIAQMLQETHNNCIEGELSNLDALIEMRKAKEESEKILEICKNFENERYNEIVNDLESYKGKYCGYEIKAVNGRQMYSYKHIQQVCEIEAKKKEI